MSYKSFFTFCILLQIIICCGKKSKAELDNVDTLLFQPENVVQAPQKPVDKLETGKMYRTKNGIDIICQRNSESSATLVTDEWMSQEEIEQFIQDKEVQSDKTLFFQYKDIAIDFYASVVDGIIKYNYEIPNSLAAAKRYRAQLDEKARKEQAEKDRIAKIEKEKNRKTVIGEWLNAGFHICIYKQRGKYYLGSVKGDNDDISELYEITRVSSKRYENRDNGDMPERFDIQSNGDIRTTVYNPDAPGGGAWVYMGTWMSLNR